MVNNINYLLCINNIVYFCDKLLNNEITSINLYTYDTSPDSFNFVLIEFIKKDYNIVINELFGNNNIGETAAKLFLRIYYAYKFKNIII